MERWEIRCADCGKTLLSGPFEKAPKPLSKIRCDRCNQMVDTVVVKQQ